MPGTAEATTETGEDLNTEPTGQENVNPAGAEDGAGEGAASPPDVSEQLAALAQEVRALREPAGQEPAVSGLEDLFSYDDLGDEPDPGAQPGAGQEPGVGTQQQPGQLSPEEADRLFNEAIRERVSEAVYPYLEAIDREMRHGQLNKLAESELPELRDPEVVKAVKDRLRPIAERYDDPGLLSDPELVRQAVLAERALRAANGEVSAEEARNRGASLETGAGAAVETDDDPIAQFKRDFLGQGGPKDAFT